MKFLKLFIFAVLGILLTLACNVNRSEEALEGSPENLALENKAKHDGEKYKGRRHRERRDKVISFEGNFFTSNPGVGVVPDERCAPPALLETQVGEGKAKRLGRFTFNSTFCIDLTDIAPPPLGGDGQLTEGEALPFYGGITTFTFANGDELYARGGSAVLPPENQDSKYNAEFSNSFAFIGGTGRFEGAKGGGTTNSLVKFGIGTDHEFSGVIVLLKHRGNKHWDEDDHDWDNDDDWRNRDDDDD